MDLYYLVVFFVFGLVFGSFFNVVGYRLPKKMSLISPSSHCPKCEHKLTPIELIPVFSWVFQGAKCKNCKDKIPVFYPVFETFTGVVFALIYLSFGLSLDTLIALVFASMILILIISDLLYMIIPDELLIFCGVIIFVLKVVSLGFGSIFTLLIDMLIPFIFMLLIKLIGDFIFKRESLGGGDIKLMLVFGLVLGWEISLFTIVVASFLALPVALINLIKNKEHVLPLGPFLGLAALICLISKIELNTILTFLQF